MTTSANAGGVPNAEIALIAGTGALPPHLAASLRAQGRVPIVCEMRGFASGVTGDFRRVAFRIETLGTLLETLASLKISQVCMAGAVQRPVVDPSAIDAATAPLVPRLTAAMDKGDDGTLREIIAIFEEHGFAVVGAQDIAPDLLPIAGVPTKATPPDLGADIALAQATLADMGQADLGQAMLVRDGAVICREDARGTAAMLQDYSVPRHIEPHDRNSFAAAPEPASEPTSASRADAVDQASGCEIHAKNAKGAFLFKAPKPNQSLKADMPMIGPETALQAAAAGLAGIVIAHGGVMVLDLPQVVAILDAQRMFLWVMP